VIDTYALPPPCHRKTSRQVATLLDSLALDNWLAHHNGMAEPLSATGGISAAIQILSLAAQGYLSIKGGLEEYQLVGRQLLDYQEDFKGSKIRLESWCKAWRIKSADQTSFGISIEM
jgi:hypothetical protein